MKKFKKIYNFTAIFEPAEEGGYVVYVPAIPGCVTQGETFEEAEMMAKDAIEGCLNVLKSVAGYFLTKEYKQINEIGELVE